VAKKRQICLLEIDYQGAKTIKDLSGIDCHYIFITCNGGLETLTNRLKCRNTETEQQIEKRLKTAEKEFDFLDKNPQFFDFILYNDDLDKALTQLSEKFQEWYPWIKKYAVSTK